MQRTTEHWTWVEGFLLPVSLHPNQEIGIMPLSQYNPYDVLIHIFISFFKLMPIYYNVDIACKHHRELQWQVLNKIPTHVM